MADEFYTGQLVRKRIKHGGNPQWYVGEVNKPPSGGGLLYSIKLLHLETHHPNGKITRTATLKSHAWWIFSQMKPHDAIERLAELL